MPLTPADVHNVAFKKPSIGKRGYDEDEVDAFLDVVEAELSRLIEENSDLKNQLDGSGSSAPAASPVLEKKESATPAPSATSSESGHVQAARLLGLAQETADKLTAEAQAESDKLVSDAKAQSDALITDATTRAEAAERDSRVKAEALDAEAKAKYDQVLGTLATERVGLEKKIADLRTYEREYRGRLKSWISDQLAQLDNGGNNGQPAAPILTSPGE